MPDVITVAESRAWEGRTKTCPHCGETKPAIEGFGLVRQGRAGKVKPHGWCQDCRRSTNYHARPRKNLMHTPGRKRKGPTVDALRARIRYLERTIEALAVQHPDLTADLCAALTNAQFLAPLPDD